METILQIAKDNADKANLYGKLSAMYKIQALIQKEIIELERKLVEDDKQK
tara:strand:- start:60 stop:209 length:150 start_codon:yes stop_codon:yes gene_type:complete